VKESALAATRRDSALKFEPSEQWETEDTLFVEIEDIQFARNLVHWRSVAGTAMKQSSITAEFPAISSPSVVDRNSSLPD
jgi:hypothetical protein